MALSDDHSGPELSDTTVDSADPFDTTAQVVGGRQTQLTSDPPTALVRHDSFRELPPGCVVDEIYEIDARLGAGAMGEVYAARHAKLGKRVAIKVIGRRLSEDAAAIERFAMEARTLAQIQHPAIVAVDHIGELADGRAYFVMEFLRGESLFERLQRGRVPLPEALRILDQMARGLDAAHAQGVTHRDLKPENTFLVHLPGEAPAVKLLDFGLAKLAAERTDLDFRAERTQSGVAIGTPMYMSPEQARGPDVDHRTDIYALGCVAYELILNVPPFPTARTAPELYAAHLHEAAPLPRSIWPEIPPQLDLCLFAMLAKAPEHRPTLAQVRAVLAAVRGDAAPERLPTEFVGDKRPAGRPWKILMTTTIVGVALVLGITIGSGGRSKPAISQPNDPPAPAVAHPSIGPVIAPDVAPLAPTKTQVDPTPPPQAAPPVEASPSAPRIVKGKPRTGTARQLQGSGSARLSGNASPVPTVPPVVADVPAAAPPTTPPPKSKPVDRNQTIDPFAKKRPQVTP